jgi:hypothetical protein
MTTATAAQNIPFGRGYPVELFTPNTAQINWAGRRAFSPTFPVTQCHAADRRNRGAGLQTVWWDWSAGRHRLSLAGALASH